MRPSSDLPQPDSLRWQIAAKIKSWLDAQGASVAFGASGLSGQARDELATQTAMQ